ncbi:hypothetical protein DPMN_081483 [Dreissena polymorpha]|uniref:Uncharacterized protein n=1 Tax=Dreissena polymorpha TaxID=45954 RepID=A0A9D4BGJ6_DREPO|nr:hypothetical protein DPMN_081483 [Dreissena polymorpha]
MVASAILMIALPGFIKMSKPSSISTSVGATCKCSRYQQLPIFKSTGPTTKLGMEAPLLVINSLTSCSLGGGCFMAS